MSSTREKIKGLADEIVGTVKQGIGSAVTGDEMIAEGNAQKLKGKARRTVGDMEQKPSVSDDIEPTTDSDIRKM